MLKLKIYNKLIANDFNNLKSSLTYKDNGIILTNILEDFMKHGLDFDILKSYDPNESAYKEFRSCDLKIKNDVDQFSIVTILDNYKHHEINYMFDKDVLKLFLVN